MHFQKLINAFLIQFDLRRATSLQMTLVLKYPSLEGSIVRTRALSLDAKLTEKNVQNTGLQ